MGSVPSVPNKADPAPEHYAAALFRWVEMTVALTMVHGQEPLDSGERKARTAEIIGRWRGNRGEDWKPTIGDLDRLIESTLLWGGQRVRPTFPGWTD